MQGVRVYRKTIGALSKNEDHCVCFVFLSIFPRIRQPHHTPHPVPSIPVWEEVLQQLVSFDGLITHLQFYISTFAVLMAFE